MIKEFTKGAFVGFITIAFLASFIMGMVQLFSHNEKLVSIPYLTSMIIATYYILKKNNKQLN